jgi:hypothetical protein
VKDEVSGTAASLVERFGQHAILLLGALAAGTYGVLRLVYLHFYYVFSVAPEEVGLGKTELLSQALVGPILVLLIAAIVSLFMEISSSLAVRSFKTLGRWRREPGANQVNPSSDSHTKPAPLNVKLIESLRNLLIGMVVALPLIVVLLFISANQAADSVKRGYTISDFRSRFRTFQSSIS